MDIGTWIGVLWRFRLLLALGFLIASTIAVTSVARVEMRGGAPQVSYRASEVWTSTSTLLVSQEGFPWGRAVLDEVVPVEGEGDGGEQSYVPRYGNDARYSGLAALYTELAKSDAVVRVALAGAAPDEGYEPEVVKAADGTTVLPLISMKGYGPSPEAAMTRANRATDAFLDYLVGLQAGSGIARDKRVDVTVIKEATEAELFQSRSFVRPAFLFLLVLMIFIGMAFVLENLRPRARPPAAVVPAEYPPRARRSA